jgi:TolB protein
VASREEPVAGRENYKEIYMLDWDGANITPVTSSRTITISPAWSTAGDKVAYTSFTYHTASKMRNSDLFIYDLNLGKRYLTSYWKGVNSGAAFLPGDKEILLTLTKDGNPDIYRLTLDSGKLTALTHGPNHALNVEPAISPDGKRVAFSSDRSGQPMVYVMNIDGTGLKRLTFAGVYNSTPSWSPDGKTLALAILDSSHFDIFTIGADGSNLKRLTDARKKTGRPANNESPSWSPDGTHIVFVSDRIDGKQIYIVNADGTIERRITHDHALWDRPKWSPMLSSK